jgi:3-oxoacyl-[acyl-carrier protein] reductase
MKAAELFDLTGEVALVTGASSGLGWRFARVLAANGAAVAGVARRKGRLDALVEEITSAGGRAIACAADATDAAAVARAFDEAEAAFGPVTILVNNAGVGHSTRLIDTDRAAWRETLDLNLDALHYAGVAFAKRLGEAKDGEAKDGKVGRGGAIINIASILGLGVGRGLGAYAVAKAGVIQLTRAMALEYAKLGIRANAIAPGYFSTEINADWLAGEGAAMAKEIPARRFGKEGELDGALLLLASPKAGGYTTGATYVVDGGHSIALRGL